VEVCFALRVVDIHPEENVSCIMCALYSQSNNLTKYQMDLPQWTNFSYQDESTTKVYILVEKCFYLISKCVLNKIVFKGKDLGKIKKFF